MTPQGTDLRTGAKMSIDQAHSFLEKPRDLKGERHDRIMHRIRRGEHSTSHLESLELIYLLGGARGAHGITPPIGKGVQWTDCSGFAIFELAVMGVQLKAPTGWTGTLVQEGHAGVSEYFTLFLKEPEQTEGHVIERRRHRPHAGRDEWRWSECGGFDNPKAGDGPAWFHPTPERIAEFPFQRHFAVLA